MSAIGPPMFSVILHILLIAFAALTVLAMLALFLRALWPGMKVEGSDQVGQRMWSVFFVAGAVTAVLLMVVYGLGSGAG
jgi:hypothetical protein